MEERRATSRGFGIVVGTEEKENVGCKLDSRLEQ